MMKPRPFGHYFILEKIAQGGMAEIFKGLTYDFSGAKKVVVIKRILPHAAKNEEFIRMLISEAKIAVNLSHGNVAQVYDLGKVGDDYFIVMEYVEGKNLAQVLKQCGEKGVVIPVECCVYLITEICKGLEHMHEKRDTMGNALEIIHRDISPQNVMVSYGGQVKIIDFGVAKAAFELPEEDDGGVLKGKFSYMSPEQLNGEEVSPASDLFSLGVVFWELLTGQRLFKKKTNQETVEAVRQMVVLPPSQFRSDISQELDEIVFKILERSPEHRFASAHDLNLALSRFLLKNYPKFKPQEFSLFLAQIFSDEDDLTTTFALEKTERGLLVKKKSPLLPDESTVGVLEETQNVKREEIDFHSVFDEMSWNEESGQKLNLKQKIDPSIAPVFSNFEELSETGPLPLPVKKNRNFRRFLLPVLFFIFVLVYLFLIVKSYLRS